MTHDQGVVVRELLLSKIGAICSADSEGFVCKICQISGITQIRLLLRGAVSGGDSSIDIRFQLRLSRADVVVSNLLRLCVARSIDAL